MGSIYTMRYSKNLKNYYNYFYYIASGRRPWARGYNEYKTVVISKIIKNRNFDQLISKNNYGYRIDERVIEYPWFFAKLTRKAGKLLDAGSILNYEYILDLPELSNKNIHILTLSPESNCYWKKGVSYVFEDIRACPYIDDYFDTIVSISTIEHIGLDNTLLYSNKSKHKENSYDTFLVAIREFKRILKEKGKLYITVPFGKHKNHKWFQIFNSNMIDMIIHEFQPNHYQEECFMYDKLGWHKSNREKSKNATYFDIHKNKNYDNDFAAASRAVICLELTK